LFEDAKILVVEDELDVATIMQQYLTRLGFLAFSAADGEEALKKVTEIKPDIILLDVMLPKLNGYEVCKRLKESEKTRLIPIIMVTALGEKEQKIKGIESGADEFLTKPIDREEFLARARSLLKVKFLNEQLETAETILYALVGVLDAKDAYTSGHTERVTEFATKLANELELPQDEVDLINKAARLHDIGKIGVSDVILNKPGALTEEEFEHIKTHPVVGERICEPLKSLQPVLKIIRHHHERWDGRGYPDGIKGDIIPYGARVIAVADSYDAMAADRPYRKRLPDERIINIFKAGAGTQWDEKITHAFMRMLEEKRI